jgi:hypothetical protein
MVQHGENTAMAQQMQRNEEHGMRKRLIRLIAAGLFTVPGVSSAQNVPPSTDNPQTKRGGTIVVNPTDDGCKRGWNADMRWTQEQFRQSCAKLNTSK